MAAFVMDRGYDDNKMFLKLDSMGQDYVIRFTERCRLFFHGKWVLATWLRDGCRSATGTGTTMRTVRKDIYLVLVYGTTEHPMMLATNKKICSKEDVIKVAKLYFSR